MRTKFAYRRMERLNFELSNNDLKKVEAALLKLKETCQMLNVPMFATVAVENNDEKTIYNSIVNGAGSHDMKLTNDQIRKHILIANQFEIIKDDTGEASIVPPKDKKRLRMSSTNKTEKIDEMGEAE